MGDKLIIFVDRMKKLGIDIKLFKNVWWGFYLNSTIYI